MKPRSTLPLALLLGVALAPALASTPSRPGVYDRWASPTYDGYRMSSQYVTMRDGTRIAIDIFRPTRAGKVEEQALPVVWMNTPYNRRGHEGGFTASDYPGAALSLVKYGYVVAVADMRGTGASFGRALHSNRTEWAPWARTDAYDITEWLARQAWSDAKVGMWGCSATGHSQWQAAAMKPPHLKVIFPMSAPSEYYDWNGVYPVEEGKEAAWPASAIDPREEKSAVPVDGDTDRALLHAALEEHRWSLDYGPVPYRDSASPEMARRLGIKGWKVWEEVSTLHHLPQVNAAAIPAYQSANYGEDQRVKLGVFIKRRNVKAPMKLVLGPSNHCQWSSEYRAVKDNPFNITVELLRWYDYWLKGVDNGITREPGITYYTYNAPPGREWAQAWQWPIPVARPTRYYFAPRGGLTLSAPGGVGGDDYRVDYTVDRASRMDKGFLVTTAPFARDSEMTGHPVLHLWIKSTAPDGDFFASLADVAPDGRVTPLPGSEDGQLRASMRALGKAPYDNLGLPYHRAYQADERPLVPGRVTALVFDLAPMSWVFRAGHRLRLVLTNAAPPRHAGAPSQTKVFDPAPTITYLHASYLELPQVAPLRPAVQRVKGGAVLTFPASLDARYMRDIDPASLMVDGQRVKGWAVAGHRLSIKGVRAGADIIGRFGKTYDYGEAMRFEARVK